eukprot:CAMPEP_0118949858 /NCGR_PEP_ID=MMETSP1169-20130426/50366_1 /TAXON_ID=36882 /ORGANISM="Pyramimonas obovata, Strain CCMP722" /LENGTH=397 /DNA_ID=CAMNT_0006896569 /DNA_START=110 /DNA_END=1300 /DNA_ORIENTATION=+
MEARAGGQSEKIARTWPVQDASTAQEFLRASYEFQKELPDHIRATECLQRLCNYLPSTSQQDDSETVAASTSGEALSKENGAHELEGEEISDDQLQQLQIQRTVLSYLARGLPVPQEAMRGIVSRVLETESTSVPKEIFDGCSALEFPHDLRTERERRMSAKCEDRMSQLYDLLVEFPPQIQWKAAVERKCLQAPIRQLQRRLREQVLYESQLASSVTPTTLLDWRMYRREKEPPPGMVASTSDSQWAGSTVTVGSRELTSSSKLEFSRTDMYSRAERFAVHAEARMKDDLRRKTAEAIRRREVREARLAAITARRDFLLKMFQLRTDVKKSASEDTKLRKLRNDGVLNYHSRERKRAQREEGARMQALRSGDTAAYMELLDNAKNQRLKELLMKTD